MNENDASPNSAKGPDKAFMVPPFVSVTDVTSGASTQRSYVVCNDATGKFFDANESTVAFIEALRRTGDVANAMHSAGIPKPMQNALLGPLLQAGVIVQPGQTQKARTAKAPIEGKLISMRFDMFDAASIAATFGWLGRAAFSTLGFVLWGGAILAALFQLLSNTDKIALALGSLPQMGWANVLVFGLIYIILKSIHELGHALAYRVYCTRAGLDPGPIRMGIAIFAMTPFPFTDVTGAWRLKSRLHRAMIGAGGMYLETWAIALLTLLWSQVQSGPIQTIILQVAVVSGCLTLLFNLNPAVKLDGYYILTDILRRPNLASRASKSARHFALKTLGGAGNIDPFDMGYWVVSYLYRWTIFAGIFWLAYQFDPRLAPIVGIITVIMLVLRPLWSTIQFLRQRSISVVRGAGAICLIGLVLSAFFVPFQDRLLLSGRYHIHETRFVEPIENGRIIAARTGFDLQNPELLQQLSETRLQTEIVRNTARAVSVSAGEQAALGEDITRLRETEKQLGSRLAALGLVVPDSAVWTPLDGMEYVGSWVTRASVTVGSVSEIVPAFLSLALRQSHLERDLDLSVRLPLRVRIAHSPHCEFNAFLQAQKADFTSQPGFIILRAIPTDIPPCAQDLRSGATVVARLETTPKSIATRLRIFASRLLQDRLPVNIN